MSVDLTIRAVDTGDEEALWRLLEPVFRGGETYCQPRDISRDAALRYWTAGHEVFAAVADGEAVGTYYLGRNQKGGGAHVCNCGYVIGRDAEGRGVGRAMLEHSLDTARARGFLAIQFNFVVETNTRAVATWAAYGFAVVGRLPQAFRRPSGAFVDALVMHRFL